MLRGGMIGLIYTHALSVQDGVNDDSAAVTLMSTDVDTISNAVTTVHEIWAQIIEVIIGFWLLARRLGWVSIVPFMIVLFCSRLSKRIGGHLSKRQKAWLAAQQKRIAMTSSMLGSMRSLKMMGSQDTVESIIQDQRLREIDMAKQFRWMMVLLNTIGELEHIQNSTKLIL